MYFWYSYNFEISFRPQWYWPLPGLTPVLWLVLVGLLTFSFSLYSWIIFSNPELSTFSSSFMQSMMNTAHSQISSTTDWIRCCGVSFAWPHSVSDYYSWNHLYSCFSTSSSSTGFKFAYLFCSCFSYCLPCFCFDIEFSFAFNRELDLEFPSLSIWEAAFFYFPFSLFLCFYFSFSFYFSLSL